jgi:predicted lipoprotein with Yx(FWY)xxD motif
MRISGILMAACGAIMLAGAAYAAPPGVTEKDGHWISPDNKPLYTFVRDTTPGKSSCTAGCVANWPVLAAAADAKDDGDWTVITRDDGAKQWAYKGKPLYTFARDTAGQPTTTPNNANWPLAAK